MKSIIRSALWKIISTLLQFILVIVIIIFLARTNYLPILFPDSWKEWIIDVTDKLFGSRGTGNIGHFIQNAVSLKFLDSDASQNELLIENQKKNFNNLLKEINKNLNVLAGSYELIMALDKTEEDVNISRASAFLGTILYNTSDYDAFLVYNLKQKKLAVKVNVEEYEPKLDVFEEIAKSVKFEKLASQTEPVIYLRGKKLIFVYAFKGDTNKDLGILFAVMSTDFFKRDLTVLQGKKYHNFAFFSNELAFFREDPDDVKANTIIKGLSFLPENRKYFTGEASILPQLGYRASARSFEIRNPLSYSERISVNIGIFYPKNIVIAIIGNIFLLGFIALGIIVIIKMYRSLKFAVYAFNEHRKAPYILLDESLEKMNGVFTSFVESTKRIKSNYAKQKVITERFLKNVSFKSISYKDKKQEKKTDDKSFPANENELKQKIQTKNDELKQSEIQPVVIEEKLPIEKKIKPVESQKVQETTPVELQKKVETTQFESEIKSNASKPVEITTHEIDKSCDIPVAQDKEIHHQMNSKPSITGDVFKDEALVRTPPISSELLLNVDIQSFEGQATIDNYSFEKDKIGNESISDHEAPDSSELMQIDVEIEPLEEKFNGHSSLISTDQPENKEDFPLKK